MTDRIDPDSLPAHAIEAACAGIHATEYGQTAGDGPEDWMDEARAAVAAFLDALMQDDEAMDRAGQAANDDLYFEHRGEVGRAAIAAACQEKP